MQFKSCECVVCYTTTDVPEDVNENILHCKNCGSIGNFEVIENKTPQKFHEI